MVLAKFTAAIVAAAVAVASASGSIIHPDVHRALREQDSVNLIIEVEKPIATLQSVKDQKFDSREEQVSAVVKALRDQAALTQAPIKEMLSKSSGEFTSSKQHWISNAVYVEGATTEFVEKLFLTQGIASVREEKMIPLIDPELRIVPDNNATRNLQASNVEWGIERVRAPSIWDSGNTGEGIVAGIIDTGARVTHEAIKDNFLGDYGWFDPYTGRSKPFDDQGHGTHVTGTIAGSKGIGVAPGAKWMMCRGCSTRTCAESALLACGEFITCPTDPQGNNEDCSKAPHVVNNSWGGGQGETWYYDIVEAWHAAGIIPVFALGNEGPQCSTASSPGDYDNVIGVGNIDNTDTIWKSSSKGPTVTGLMKPDISAPGTDIVSAYYGTDYQYAGATGTSMAAPHVTGIVALLLADNGDLEYDTVYSRLISTADTGLGKSGYTCGGISDQTYPNNVYGHGVANAESLISS